jgi:hypothetical protein
MMTALAAVLAELDREQPYDLDAAIERMRAAGMPKFGRSRS